MTTNHKSMSLRQKTLAYWTISTAYTKGEGLSVGKAIDMLSDLEGNVNSQRLLATHVTHLLDTIIGKTRKPQRYKPSSTPYTMEPDGAA